MISLLMAGKALHLGDISFFSFDGIVVSTYCRGVVATTLSLSSAVPEISLVVLVFLWVGGGSLLSRR